MASTPSTRARETTEIQTLSWYCNFSGQGTEKRPKALNKRRRGMLMARVIPDKPMDPIKYPRHCMCKRIYTSVLKTLEPRSINRTCRPEM